METWENEGGFVPRQDFTVVEVTVHYLCDECGSRMRVCGETLTNDGVVYSYMCLENSDHRHKDTLRYPRTETREVPFNARRA
ncbi:hypothetical protein HWB76_gp098 [Streptomyces phage Blueeyedbeauty]|uniref:Uncharacterized protein n=1 Tax=Streptomyces phage Blueeyedbeauty TaxID=2250336 RepID=A0A345L201_9CAUD|nr:hypothetical protein HWB76_gp098 [Streptomyces phage Blueeyedbeauty]AXH49303.1 hypothetical protein SEA_BLUEEYEDBEAUTY_195 [Streptomyces phage Blueeyedbeauty]